MQAESGMMGGSESLDFLAPSGSGENTLVTCERGDYAADSRSPTACRATPSFPDALDAPGDVETPGIATCEDLAGFLGLDLAATSKAMPVVASGQVVLALVRGRRPARRGKARGDARRARQARAARTRSAKRSAPSPGLSAPSASAAGSCSTRRCARVSSSPARTAPGSISEACSTDATSTPR